MRASRVRLCSATAAGIIVHISRPLLDSAKATLLGDARAFSHGCCPCRKRAHPSSTGNMECSADLTAWVLSRLPWLLQAVSHAAILASWRHYFTPSPNRHYAEPGWWMPALIEPTSGGARTGQFKVVCLSGSGLTVPLQYSLYALCSK